MFCFSQNLEYPEPIEFKMSSSFAKNCSSTDGRMPDERQWFYFVYASLGTYFTGLFFAFIYSAVKSGWKKLCKKEKHITETQLLGSSFAKEIQEWADSVNSGQSLAGRVLVVFVFFCNLMSMGLYIIDTTSQTYVEECIVWQEKETLILNFAVGIINLLYFLLRALATENFMLFMGEMETIVDMLTLPPLFMSIWIERTWLGLRFFRFLIWFNFPDILVYLRVLSNSSSIRLAQLVSYIIGGLTWFAGLIYLLENSGDPWLDFAPEHRAEPGSFDYLDAIWFLMVTCSTVGYGDVSPSTVLGKIAVMFFLCIAIASFANFVPEIVELLGNRPKYAGSYKVNSQRQFIVVCGNINFDSVHGFLKDFFHPARDDTNCEVVFLNKTEPDLMFEGLLKRERTRVTYFQGTMLNPQDLQRVCAEKAAAVLVLCNKFSTDPKLEDASNIMRVISLKNYCENTRVVIQLLQYNNKAYLLNIPGWDWRRDDQAVCLNEVKYGLMAQSVLAPGFFTLASNVVTSSIKEITPEMPRWKQEYMTTSHKVILAETFSPTFVGLSFQEVAEICYLRLNLVLIAIEARKYEGGRIWINPINKKVTPNAIGLFITESSDAAKRAWFFCRVCHENLVDMTKIRKCSCKRLAKARYEYYSESKEVHCNGYDRAFLAGFRGINGNLSVRENNSSRAGLRQRKASQAESEKEPEDIVESSKMTYDATGCFHWCTSRSVDECTLSRQEATVTMFSGHIIVAIFAEQDSPLLGLRNLVMPLRASNISFNDLRHVIILGNLDFVKREWHLLKNLPKISIMEGSPMSRADLRALKIKLCRTCILLSAKVPEKSEPVLADKEIIMAALNIKSMNFGSDFLNVNTKDEDINISEVNSNGIPILLDLAFATNVRYLDDHEMHIINIELYKTLPYACGVAMARGILDSLMSATYFNASALRLLRQLVTGGASFELEKSLAEGAGLRGGYSTPETLDARNRVRVEEIVLRDSVWAKYAQYGARFSELFAAAIREQGTLCLGIYRLLDDEKEDIEDPDVQLRFVLGTPDNTTLLQPSDHIIALVQWEEGDKEKRE